MIHYANPDETTFTGSTCQHTPRRQVGSERGYTAPVAVHPYTEENRAAHGNIVITQECSDCGAHRLVAINGSHEELGPWGPSLAARQADARRAREAARAAIAAIEPLVLTRGDRTAKVTIDAEGYLSVDGARWDEIEPALAATQWLDRAKAARAAVRRAKLCLEDGR